jgi:hypothetical protein
LGRIGERESAGLLERDSFHFTFTLPNEFVERI